MLIEKGRKAYISDKIVDGVVKKATRYICLNGVFTRVGDSVDIKGAYKNIRKHNIVARHSFDEMPEFEEEIETLEEETIEEDQNEDGNQEDDLEKDETSEEETGYTFMELKAMNKQEQNAIAKSLGLKGYHNLAEDDRIEMILNAK